MDLKVLEVQKWLNLTYGNHPDFPAVTEDGLTGNSTIKALIRGLQIEAGVKVDGVLGSGSLAAIGTISPSLDTSVQTNRKQRWTRGYKRYKETSGLIEWKECQIFHSIFT